MFYKDILTYIAHYLPPTDFVNFSESSKLFHQACEPLKEAKKKLYEDSHPLETPQQILQHIRTLLAKHASTEDKNQKWKIVIEMHNHLMKKSYAKNI